MNWIFCTVIAAASALIASMGVGGGAVLLLFLTLFSQMPLRQAQGINLLFFLPVAAVALLFHHKNGLLQCKKALCWGLWGLPGVWTGLWLNTHLDSRWIGKTFAVFLFFLGLQTFFSAKTKKEPKA